MYNLGAIVDEVRSELGENCEVYIGDDMLVLSFVTRAQRINASFELPDDNDQFAEDLEAAIRLVRDQLN